MGKSNGKPEAETHGLDVEHELPPGDGDETTSASSQSGAVAAEPTGVDAELAEGEGRARFTARPVGPGAG